MGCFWCGRIVVLVAVLGFLGPAVSAAVVINEIMYHAGSDRDTDDFIELYNTGGAPVDLSNWCLDGVVFCFAPGASIAAGQYLVLVADAAQFTSTYGAGWDHTWQADPPTVLADNGERLALLDDMLVVVDEVVYDDAGQWPVTPDGLGPSLELIDPDQDNSTPRAWRASSAGQGTPGALNSVDAAGLPPWIDDVQHTPNVAPSSPIVVSATVLDGTTVDLTYKIDWGPETTVPMVAQGGDLYDFSIAGQPPGTLVRYRISVSGPTGVMQFPREDDTVLYSGTAVIDPLLSSQLPIFHWFIPQQDTCYVGGNTCDDDGDCVAGPGDTCTSYSSALVHKFTDETEKAVLFYDDRLYDGVSVRVRGESARSWDKPPWKFIMPQGHDFEAPDLIEAPVDNFNMQSNYADKSYAREILAWESLRDAGAPASRVFPVRLERNGQFFGLFNWLETPDADWVVRNGLSPTGSRYKAFDDMRPHASQQAIEPFYEKKTRFDEDHTDIWQFTRDLSLLSGVPLRDYLIDHVDIPGMINYLAVQSVLHNNDHLKKNYYAYRDTDGTGRWTMLAWDLDLTLGRNFFNGSLNDVIWADDDVIPGLPSNISPSHPLFGTSARRKVTDGWNRLIDRFLGQDEMRTMFFRRLRSLMDQLLLAPHYEDRIAELVALFASEAELDRQLWGQYGASQDLTTATGIIEQDYLNARRIHLYTTHSVCDIPGPQPVLPTIVISEIMYNPPGGDGDEYVELYNPSMTQAIDISGWRLDGVAANIPPGAVILPGGYALLVKNDTQFRATYGGGKFVAAQYNGTLNDLGESLVLRNQFGGVVAAVAFDEASPWPVGASGVGYSLELVDPAQDNSKVVNWAASTTTGGSPGAVNGANGTTPPVPALFVNEVLADNQSINQDEFTEFDPWIEIYNASSQTIDLEGMYLSNDLAVSNMWQVPVTTELCGRCWMLFWADGPPSTGDRHTNFTLSSSGGSVGLFTSGGTLIDYLTYPVLPTDYSFGRFPDGGSDLRVFSTVTHTAANNVPPTSLILNEYNAVSPLNLLKNLGSDTQFSRIPGNGGDWFELVVTENLLDITGWQLELRNDAGGVGETLQTLTFSAHSLWQTLRSGSIITISEELADDLSYDPQAGDWTINARAADSGTGSLITAQDFEVSNVNWQLTIKDDQGIVQFGPAGEGVWPLSGVGSDEVFKLEEDPGPFITEVDDYNDGSSSTFAAPNVYAAGSRVQDFTTLRDEGLQGLCTVPDADGDMICDAQDNCPNDPNPGQEDVDGDGLGDACDGCPLDPDDDADGDGFCSDVDNCPTAPNPGQSDGDSDQVGTVCDNCPNDPNTDQADEDGDGLGDVCDPCLGDSDNDADGDTVCEKDDNCPGMPNPPSDCDSNVGTPDEQCDDDLDGLGNACDNCPSDALNDFDLDTICGDVDNCPFEANTDQSDVESDGFGDLCDNCPDDSNASQTDTDSDGVGNVCDADDDGDGILDDGDGSMVEGDNYCVGGQTVNCDDNCPLVADPDQSDTNSDGEGDVCSDDDDGDGRTDSQDNCPLVYNPDPQINSDSDSAGDACDCAINDAGVDRLPGAVAATVTMDRSGGGTLYWKRSWQGHVSNVYRGTFASGQPWNYDEVCLDAETPQIQSTDAAAPPPGTGYYYLVSGRNVCGEGPAGHDSQGVEIVPGTACPAAGGDFDGDSIPNLQDNCPLDVNTSLTDSDSDFIGNACDNCQNDPNPFQEDNDGDSSGDVCDDDDDNDGVADGSDNCPLAANAPQDCDADPGTPDEQCDLDGDGVGDACDACSDADGDGLADPGFLATRCGVDPFPDDPENDTDQDGIGVNQDNCPTDQNAGQEDSDSDGLGDACDACPEDPENDADGDAICAGSCGLVEIQVLDIETPDETVIIEFGYSMKYLANGVDPGLGLTWTQELFDDSGWTPGIYGVGYEAVAGAEALIATSVPVGTQSIYTRATFNIADVGAVTDLWVGADYDDGYVIWLNGERIYSSPEMATDSPDWDHSPASHESSNGSVPDYGVLINVSGKLPHLKNGTNVLAVGVWNRVPAMQPSADLVLVPKLAMNRVPSMAYLANSSDPGLGITWTAEGFDDSGWSAGNYGVGYESAIGATNLVPTVVPAGTLSVYTRTQFLIPEVGVIDRMFLGVDYDDGFVAWVNGVEVVRSPEMPAGDPDWNTPAAAHESSNAPEPLFEPAFDISDAAIPALHNGINSLAVGVWNTNGSSTDLVLYPSLSTDGLAIDNCPYVANPSQLDDDNDGVGTMCDNCPNDFNPNQNDLDGDGTGDVCEI